MTNFAATGGVPGPGRIGRASGFSASVSGLSASWYIILTPTMPDSSDTRTRASLTVLESQQREARATIEKCRLAVVEADRRLRLLQNLRKSDHASWTAAWNRELEAFAAESFLGKLQLENGRARSSAG